MAASKHYVVWVGNRPGIYTTWKECQEQVNGFTGAKFKSFESAGQAAVAFKEGWKGYWGQEKTSGKAKPYAEVKKLKSTASEQTIDYNSISVDVGTRGNPGPVEFKGVDTQTGDLLFYVGPIPNGTNNLGEFIAIVHALDYLKKKGSTQTIYTDSRTALSWIRNKKTGSTLTRDSSTAKIWALTDWAIDWLQNNKYENKILKWNTEEWGEIKADFGRK